MCVCMRVRLSLGGGGDEGREQRGGGTCNIRLTQCLKVQLHRLEQLKRDQNDM